MARQIKKRDISPIIDAAGRWLRTCLVEDGSLFSSHTLWSETRAQEVRDAFIGHPDTGSDDFMTKLKGQMRPAPAASQKLMAEMLWALLLFPSNMKARTKRQQISEIWALSGDHLAEETPQLSDKVLVGIGSGGPGFNNYRAQELAFLVDLTCHLKSLSASQRVEIFGSYDFFAQWIDSVPRKGKRQYRHMLRYFAFPDRVERMSSNNDRRRILQAFDVGPSRITKEWTDRQLDDALLKLRQESEQSAPGQIFDFYEPPLRERWIDSRKVATHEGPVTVVVPSDEEDEESVEPPGATEVRQPEARQSIQIQAKLAEIGAIMGFKVWIPRGDRARVTELLSDTSGRELIETLPLNYDKATLDTIEQIDVLWLRRRSIVRAFEVEHTTAVYSGLLRMADLLALQPNMSIRLHIVAPDERREKVFREMLRPVFSLLESGPLSRSCTFMSYESVDSIRALEHLAHTHDGVIGEYEEAADESE
jgi:hypothetical protein